jgi:hypothetical protein
MGTGMITQWYFISTFGQYLMNANNHFGYIPFSQGMINASEVLR